MGIEKLLNATYDNADLAAAAPVAVAAQPLGGVALGGAARGRAVDWKPPKREPADRAGGPVRLRRSRGRPRRRARPRRARQIDLRGDSDVEMIAAPAPAQQAPIEIDSDAAPSPIAVDADGEPWTCARCTYARTGRPSAAPTCGGDAPPRRHVDGGLTPRTTQSNGQRALNPPKASPKAPHERGEVWAVGPLVDVVVEDVMRRRTPTLRRWPHW